jgi:hypothetical protein
VRHWLKELGFPADNPFYERLTRLVTKNPGVSESGIVFSKTSTKTWCFSLKMKK